MKTSYVYKNKQVSEDSSEVQSESGGTSAVEVYLHLHQLSQELAVQREKEQREGAVKATVPQEEDTLAKPAKKKSKVGLIVGISAAVLVLGVGGTIGYKVYSTKVLNENYQNFCTELSSNYLANPGESIAYLSEESIEYLRQELDTYTAKGIDTTDTSAILSDMSQCLKDMEIVQRLKDVDADISDSAFLEDLDLLKSGIETNYTTDSIQSVVKSEYTSIQSQVDVYSYIKESLLGVTDLSSVSEEYLSSEINSLGYVGAVSELSKVKSLLLSLKNAEAEYSLVLQAYNDAVSELDAVSAVELDENGNEVKLSKKEKQAKEEAIAAQQAVVDEALANLENAKHPLRDAQSALAEGRDALSGTKDYTTVLQSAWAVENAVDTESNIEDTVE